MVKTLFQEHISMVEPPSCRSPRFCWVVVVHRGRGTTWCRPRVDLSPCFYPPKTLRSIISTCVSQGQYNPWGVFKGLPPQLRVLDIFGGPKGNNRGMQPLLTTTYRLHYTVNYLLEESFFLEIFLEISLLYSSIVLGKLSHCIHTLLEQDLK